MNSKEFSLKIEAMVKEKRMPYMDAIIDYCKSHDIDVGTINSMVNKSLKEKVKHEAINLKMLKEKKGGTLPV
jgi:fumarylacetoacetate (FAA) hydrolase family protein